MTGAAHKRDSQIGKRLRVSCSDLLLHAVRSGQNDPGADQRDGAEGDDPLIPAGAGNCFIVPWCSEQAARHARNI